MKGFAKTGLGALTALLLIALSPGVAQGASGPAWSLMLSPMPSNFDPGSSLEPEYLVVATNVGDGPTTATSTLTVTLPAGLTPTEAGAHEPDQSLVTPCAITGQEVECQVSDTVDPGHLILGQVKVAVSAAEGIYDTTAAIEGGGATQTVEATSPTPVQPDPVPFDFLAGFHATLTGEGGAPATLAGSHPYQQTVSFNFPTRESGNELTNSGHPRDIWVELPRGLLGDPTASPVLCTEAQLELEGEGGCPPESQVGVADVTTALGRGNNGLSTTPIYNMVPPPGVVAELATDVAAVGIYSHILAGVRSDSDYGIEATTPDILSFSTVPIFGVQAQLWGDPSSPAHDEIRECKTGHPCPVDPRETAFITAPADCPGHPIGFEVAADPWEEPFPEFEKKRAFYESADLAGAPVHTEDCGTLAFEPTIQAKPTTNVADSPAGLDFTLHEPTDTRLSSRSPAPLRDTVVLFPAGLAVNPAQAGGLGACSEDQIGFLGEVQEEGEEDGRLDFDKQPQSCPDSAKIGTFSVTSPALVVRNEEHEVQEEEIEGEERPVLEVLHGSVFLAEPFENPFGSLTAVYLALEDPRTGIVAKLAGEGELDPDSGQITTYFERNPEVPFEDIHVHIFGGDRGAFITPPTCGAYTTETDLTPWSSPEGQDAFPTASFQVSSAPGGGPCPTAASQLPNSPKLSAGTQSPAAATYSPLLFKLSREDGSQRLAKIEATLPTGLLAKLAGVGECSEAAIAQAKSREVPNQGALEQASPSCPGASEIGTVIGSAGAGPHPYYTTGHAYLAGPYKGAPLSVVGIVPAVAGPFDLGAVVVRSALYIDPTTAQGRVVSDPLPQILHGVPIDLRSVAVNADRAQFTLNPTSCAEKAFGGQAISDLGSAAPLTERFQVGGCASLAFKPKLHLRLFGATHRGAHPRLRAVLESKPGEANIARTALTLPRSEFIDQGHFRTICTRVQYAANQCPKGAIYGHVKAISPLLDYPLEGAIYLRSSDQELPDTVFAFRGPSWQPLALDAVGHVDSVKGRLRVIFPEIPDAPLSKAIITMQGAKKGLFQNSTNICRGTHRAVLRMDGQNGRISDSRPALKVKCKPRHKKPRKGRGARR